MAEKIDESTFSTYDKIMEYVKTRRNFYIKPEYEYLTKNKDFYERKFYPLRISPKRELLEKHKNIIYDVFGYNPEILEKIIFLQKKYKLTPIAAISLFIRGDFSAENTRCELSGEKTNMLSILDGWTLCSKLKYTKMIPHFYYVFKEKTRIISRKIFRDMKTLRFGTNNIEEIFYIYKNNFVIENKCIRCGGLTIFKDKYSGYKKYCENCINNYIKPGIIKGIKEKKIKKISESLALAGIDVKERNKKNHELYLKIRKNIPIIIELRKKYKLKNSQILWHLENNDPDFQIGLCKVCGNRKHFDGYYNNYDFSDIKNEYGCFCPKYNRKNIKLITKNFYINRFNNVNETVLTRRNFLNTRKFLSLIKKGVDPIEDLFKKEDIEKNINEKNSNIFHPDDVTDNFLCDKFLVYDMYVQKCMTTIEIAQFMNISEKKIINSLKMHQFYIGRSVLNKIDTIKNKIAIEFYNYKPEDFKVLRYLVSIGERYVENLIHIKNFKHREIPLIFFIEFFNDLMDMNEEKTYLDNSDTKPVLIL